MKRNGTTIKNRLAGAGSPTSVQLTCRPRDHLALAAKLYPHAWKVSDGLRADRTDLPRWPDWTYLPMAAWYAIVSGGGDRRVPVSMIGDVGRLAALGAWRVTQGIYRFDPDLYSAVVVTPVAGDIPCDLLFRMPEWCMYIETKGMVVEGSPLHGFWAHLEWDVNARRTELRLLLDTQAALFPVPVHLGAWSLSESLARMESTSRAHASSGNLSLPPSNVTALTTIVEPLLSLLLYLCSQNAEIGGAGRPSKPTPKKTKSGPRLFAPDKARVWDVGVRLGAALRKAYLLAGEGQGGTHASPRGHIRRAHWHTYVIGKKNAPDIQERTVKWLAPISVNLDDLDTLPAAIRPVTAA